MYSLEELKELINAGATVNINISIDSSADNGQEEPNPKPDPPDPQQPDTKLVEVKEDTVLYRSHPGYPNAKNPVLQGTGIHPVIGYIYQVETPAIMADGGVMIYTIWRGENDDISQRGLFIKKEAVRNI